MFLSNHNHSFHLITLSVSFSLHYMYLSHYSLPYSLSLAFALSMFASCPSLSHSLSHILCPFSLSLTLFRSHVVSFLSFFLGVSIFQAIHFYFSKWHRCVNCVNVENVKKILTPKTSNTPKTPSKNLNLENVATEKKLSISWRQNLFSDRTLKWNKTKSSLFLKDWFKLKVVVTLLPQLMLLMLLWKHIFEQHRLFYRVFCLSLTEETQNKKNKLFQTRQQPTIVSLVLFNRNQETDQGKSTFLLSELKVIFLLFETNRRGLESR